MTPALHAHRTSTAGIYCPFAEAILRNGLSVPRGRFPYLFDLMSRARVAGDFCALNPGEGKPANAVSESAPGDELPPASGESEDHWFHFASCGFPLRVGAGEVHRWKTEHLCSRIGSRTFATTEALLGSPVTSCGIDPLEIAPT